MEIEFELMQEIIERLANNNVDLGRPVDDDEPLQELIALVAATVGCPAPTGH